ncbi:MAG: PAS domain S-box protein [Firmicutes bacterium]|nr:PAS domain S-box protein [Bacillota bacterium]
MKLTIVHRLFILVNDEACKLLGYAQEQLLQSSPLDLSRPEAADRLPNLIQRLRDTGKVAFEGMYRHGSGDYIPLEYRTSLLRTESGDAVLTHARDIAGRFRQELHLEGCSLRCTTSIGAAEYSKTLANTRDLMKAADIALYRAKERGRDQIAFYTE